MQMNLDELEMRLLLLGYTKSRMQHAADGHDLTVYSFPRREKTMPYSISTHTPHYGDPWVNLHYPVGGNKLKSHWRIPVGKAIEQIDKSMEKPDDI